MSGELEIDFTHYHDHEEMTKILRHLAQSYPNLARLTSEGASPQGREFWLMKITNYETGPPEEKPAMWIDGNTHSSEVTGCEVALYTAWYLLTEYGRSPFVTELLDDKAVYIYPRVDPDGAELFLKSPYHSTGGARYYPLPEEEWAEEDGLYPEDVNGDGEITMMRVRDPQGDWKASGLDPRIMVKRGADEKGGTYYRMYAEGLIRNYDGGEISMAPPRMGLNLNREWPANWAPHPIQQGAGPYPISQPETRAVADAWYKYRNLGGIMTYHTHSGAILRPFNQVSDDEFGKNGCERDLATYKALGAVGESITTYPLVSIWHDFLIDKLRPRHGNSKDWWYMHWGVFVYCIELWSLERKAGLGGFKERGFEASREHSEEQELALLRLNDEELGGEGFMDWTPFDHPQLGPVEIGGWRSKYTMRNPPPKWLMEEIERTYMFALKLAEALPVLRFRDVKATPVSEGVYVVEAVVENQGFLPTNISEQAKKMGVARTVKAYMAPGDGVELVSGSRRVDLGHIEGRSDRLSGFPFYGASRGKAEETLKTVRWTVKAEKTPAELEIVVKSQKAGTLKRALTLQ